MNDAFCQPRDGLVATWPHTYPCPEYSDEDWVRLGLQRVLAHVERGRAFLQEHSPRFAYQPTHSNSFAALQSERQLDLARAVHRRLRAPAAPPDHLAAFPELQPSQGFALDDPSHQAPPTTPGTTASRWPSATATAWTGAAINSATWPWAQACTSTP